MQVINTNIPSLNAQRNLNTSKDALATSLQRLSSGLRINSARDDAAGLAISERMTSQVRGMDQARRNAYDGVSLAQTAEGALSNTGEILQRIRELSVQSANSTNSTTDRQALQAEVVQLQAELNRIATTTQFNGQNLLDGTLVNSQFQIGPNANQTINVSISSTQGSAIGNYSLLSSQAGTNASGINAAAAVNTSAPANRASAQNLTLSGMGTTAAMTLSAGETAASVASKINSSTTLTGVSATASNVATITGLSQPGTITFTLIGAASASVSATIGSTSSLSTLAQAINNQSAVTGISAITNSAGSSITLVNNDGSDIKIQDVTNTGSGTMSFAGQAGAAVQLQASGGGNDSATSGGQVTLTSNQGYTMLSNNTSIFDSTSPVASSLKPVSSIDISTVTGANAAMSTVDAALQTVNGIRAQLGAMQNRFDNTAANLATNSENLQAARSRIRDADFAAETAQLTRNQILQQAGIAMLSQANSLPNQVLQLLR